MPTYRYTAKDAHSTLIRGKLDAEDREDLSRQLRSTGQFLVRCSLCRENEKAVYHPKADELSDFCTELSTMLSSGITLVRAMAIILQSDLKPKLAELYQSVMNCLQRGQSFSEALIAQNGAFPPLMIHIFQAGEASGTMDKTAKKAAEHFQKEHKIRSKIKSAMIYPVVLLCVSILVILGVFIFILPNFFSSFEGLGIELPGITKAMLAFSNLLVNQWLLCLIVVVAIALLISLVLQIPRVQYALDRFKLKIPKVGKLLRVIYTARFARTLSTLYTSGLSMIQSLNVAAQTIGNRYIAGQFDRVTAQVRGGAPLSQALTEVDGFVPKLLSITLIGEESGRLDEMLDTMADSFDFESEKAIDRLVALLEPAMIVVLGLIVGVIMISVMLPLYTMYQNLG